MIVGIGVDIADIARLDAALRRTPGLAERLFAESERRGQAGQAAAGPGLERRDVDDRGVDAAVPTATLAGCFAAKEATAKALGGPKGLRWTDAIVAHDSLGRPLLKVRGTVAEAADRLGVATWHLSISHDGGVCIAMVVAER